MSTQKRNKEREHNRATACRFVMALHHHAPMLSGRAPARCQRGGGACPPSRCTAPRLTHALLAPPAVRTPQSPAGQSGCTFSTGLFPWRIWVPSQAIAQARLGGGFLGLGLPFCHPVDKAGVGLGHSVHAALQGNSARVTKYTGKQGTASGGGPCRVASTLL
jgi:hypothetical protein